MKVTSDFFTVPCGVLGSLAVIIGTATYTSGLVGTGTIYLGKVFEPQRPTLQKMMVYGSASAGAGLFATGLAIAVAEREKSKSAREQLFTPDEIAFLKTIKPCSGCKYFHGVNYNGVDLICTVHPHGTDGGSCPDWESDKY
jgi:hypothetical protein